MKILKLFPYIFFFLFCNNSINSQIYVQDGEVLTLGDVNVVEDIIVQKGGVLVINGGLIMGMEIGSAGIFIKDGGKMISDNQGGSVAGLLEGSSFSGITVEGTPYEAVGNTDYALYLNDFSISDAQIAIAISYSIEGGDKPSINQKIYVANTDFNNCHLMVKNYDYGGNHLNRDESFNSIFFDTCLFNTSEYQEAWPIHLSFMKDLTFQNCTFDVPGEFTLHLNQLRNITVKECVFLNTGAELAMVFHRDNFNAQVVDNTIYSGLGSVGIGVGTQTAYGHIFEGIISNNTFRNCNVGISFGDAANLIQGYAGTANDVTVVGNTFIQNSTAMQISESSNLKLHLNNFTNCGTGLLFNSTNEIGNSNTSVFCNDFNGCSNSIIIRDFNLTQFTPTYGQIDDNNLFYGLGIDILNENNNQFTYNLLNQNYPGRVDNTQAVTISTSLKLNQCKKRRSGERSVNNQNSNPNFSSIAISPNPSSDGYFNLLMESAAETSNVQVLNNLGQLIYTFRIANNSTQTINLSNLSKGIYMFRIEIDHEIRTERVVIQ